MHQRTRFFGSVAVILTSRAAQLRHEPDNADLIRRMTNARPLIQVFIRQLTDAFAEVEKHYRSLPAV